MWSPPLSTPPSTSSTASAAPPSPTLPPKLPTCSLCLHLYPAPLPSIYYIIHVAIKIIFKKYKSDHFTSLLWIFKWRLIIQWIQSTPYRDLQYAAWSDPAYLSPLSLFTFSLLPYLSDTTSFFILLQPPQLVPIQGSLFLSPLAGIFLSSIFQWLAPIKGHLLKRVFWSFSVTRS